MLIGASVELFSDFSHGRMALGNDWLNDAFFAFSMLWAGAASLLYWLGSLWRNNALRTLGLGVGSIALGLLCLNALTPTAPLTPFMNWRFGSFMAVLAALRAMTTLTRRGQTPLERDLPDHLFFLGLGLLLWILTLESIGVCHYAQALLGDNWQRWAKMLASLVWSVYGAALLAGGIRHKMQNLRLAALGLLCATTIKVFVFDLGFLTGPLRVFSLAGLGIALIFISWLYSRFVSEKAQTATEQTAEAGQA